MSLLFCIVYKQPLHRIIVAMVLLVALWGFIATYAKQKLWWKVFNIGIFAGMVTVILYMTVVARGESVGGIILIPFFSFVEAQV